MRKHGSCQRLGCCRMAACQRNWKRYLWEVRGGLYARESTRRRGFGICHLNPPTDSVIEPLVKLLRPNGGTGQAVGYSCRHRCIFQRPYNMEASYVGPGDCDCFLERMTRKACRMKMLLLHGSGSLPLSLSLGSQLLCYISG